MKHARADYDRIQDPAHLIPEDEPVFLLRAQDQTAPQVVMYWAAMVEKAGGKRNIIEAARNHAIAMEGWQMKHSIKVPDMP